MSAVDYYLKNSKIQREFPVVTNFRKELDRLGNIEPASYVSETVVHPVKNFYEEEDITLTNEDFHPEIKETTIENFYGVTDVDYQNKYPPMSIFRKGSPLPVEANLSDPVYSDYLIWVRDMRSRILEYFEMKGLPCITYDVIASPRVTKFLCKPVSNDNKKIYISKYSNKNIKNDLLAITEATRINIESPVPGTNYVGIELPNKQLCPSTNSYVDKTFFVTFGDVYDREKGKDMILPIAVGMETNGNYIFADLDKMPHMLISGQTSSGKSVFINSVVSSLISNNTPEELKLCLIDPKQVELILFKGVPHLKNPYGFPGVPITDMDVAYTTLQKISQLVEDRFSMFAEVGCQNIEMYNKSSGKKPIPRIVLVIDELSQFIETHEFKDDISHILADIARLCRAAGVHLIFGTQQAKAEVVTTKIKANLNTRVSFRVASSPDSIIALDRVGAERLCGNGDGYYKSSTSDSLQRFQSCNITVKEVKSLVDWWKANWKNDNKSEGAVIIPKTSQ